MLIDIRKYPNRRYYDATHSKHLVLEDIRNLIREGHEVRVTDSKSGEDITGQVLTQIILELETPKLGAFPVTLLMHLIRMNDHVVKEFLENYVQQAARYFLQYQQQMQEHLRQGPFFAPWANWGGPFSAGTAPGPPPPEKEDIEELVTRLQKQVEELQKELNINKKRSKKKTT